MTAYKVVRESAGGRLTSFLTDGEASVQYLIGEWVHAPEWLQREGYHLMVLENPRCVREFGRILYGVEVWPCNVQIWECDVVGMLSTLPTEMLYSEWLAAGMYRPSAVLRDQWPYGTLMVERVRLTERYS
ncbi:hypothetical protein CMI37_22660 [Candidatus Pacearchaeota archaeon]|nr:hypothetical protein [Candidatus Pacearchaeota archaeon]